jgi:serine/threonine protein phosphatase PrpC
MSMAGGILSRCNVTDVLGTAFQALDYQTFQSSCAKYCSESGVLVTPSEVYNEDNPACYQDCHADPGSTAVVALLLPDKWLVTANVGNSKALLCQRDPAKVRCVSKSCAYDFLVL